MILEALLLTTLLLLLGSASYTDCRVSRIWNRHLVYAAVPIFLLDFAYYSPLAGDGLAYWQPFLLNAGCLTLAGLLLYVLHIWAAGDTKLLMLVALAIPGRLYGGQLPYAGSGILIVAFAFLAAFAYVVLCGLGQRWHASRWLQRPQGESIRTVVKKLDWPRIAASYLLMVTLVQLIMAVGHVLLPAAAAKSPLIDAAASCALILAILSLRRRMRRGPEQHGPPARQCFPDVLPLVCAERRHPPLDGGAHVPAHARAGLQLQDDTDRGSP